MELFISAPLSITGKPILSEHEIEIKFFENVDVLLEENKEYIMKGGTMTLTSIRFVYILTTSVKKHIGWAINLSNISKIEDCKTMLSSSTRARIILSTSSKTLNFKFSADKDEFLSLSQQQIKKKPWLLPTQTQQVEQTFSPSNAGVSGIIRRQEKDRADVDALTREALSDLSSLMRSAREVVSVVKRQTEYLQENKHNSVPETSTDLGEKNEIESILQSIGIISPVTKFSAGRQYHRELARQVADILLTGNVLRKMGGIASLIDLYCLVNRARGTELVSPDDFLSAAKLLDSLQVGLRFKQFSSGVMSVCLEEISDSSAMTQFTILLSSQEIATLGLSANLVCQKIGVSVAVAKEQLLACEAQGFLCRDDTIEGVFFFPNKFPDFVIS